MSYAITHAANTTASVTWTNSGNVVTVANWPTNFHAAYASDTHTATVVQLADAQTGVQPAVTQASTGGVIGLSGATLLGLGIVVWFAARWKHHDKPVRKAFVMGAIATVLVGSWGLFGQVTGTIKSTGDSVGNSVGTTIGQQTSVTR